MQQVQTNVSGQFRAARQSATWLEARHNFFSYFHNESGSEFHAYFRQVAVRYDNDHVRFSSDDSGLCQAIARLTLEKVMLISKTSRVGSIIADVRLFDEERREAEKFLEREAQCDEDWARDR